MPRRTHKRKALIATERQVNRPDRRSRSAQGVFFNPGIIRGISVKIDGLLQPLEVFWVMDLQNFLLGGKSRHDPGPIGMLIAKVGFGRGETGRALRMIICAEDSRGLVENDSWHIIYRNGLSGLRRKGAAYYLIPNDAFRLRRPISPRRSKRGRRFAFEREAAVLLGVAFSPC